MNQKNSVQMNLRIDEELYIAIKMYCVSNGITITKLVSDYFIDIKEKQENKK